MDLRRDVGGLLGLSTVVHTGHETTYYVLHSNPPLVQFHLLCSFLNVNYPSRLTQIDMECTNKTPTTTDLSLFKTRAVSGGRKCEDFEPPTVERLPEVHRYSFNTTKSASYYNLKLRSTTSWNALIMKALVPNSATRCTEKHETLLPSWRKVLA